MVRIIHVLLLIVFCTATNADDCIKIVSNRYCLGGNFELEASKHTKKFDHWRPKIDKGFSSVSFDDDDVFFYKMARVTLLGFEGKVFRIIIYPLSTYYTNPSIKLFELEQDSLRIIDMYRSLYKDRQETSRQIIIQAPGYQIEISGDNTKDYTKPLSVTDLFIVYEDIDLLRKSKIFERSKSGF